MTPILQLFFMDSVASINFAHALVVVSHFLLTVNSAVNPAVYAFIDLR